MVYGYIRVSTDRQTVENQRFEILRFCKKNSLEVGAWIEETISGTLTPDKRELGRLLSHIRKNDLIICSELSRLGRSLFMIMSILNLIIIHYITNNQNNHVTQNFFDKICKQGKRIINNLTKVCAKKRFLGQKHSDCCDRVSGQFYSYFATISV